MSAALPRQFLALLLVTIAAPAAAQTFQQVTDPSNPVVVSGGPAPGYAGASWPDADGDGDVDLFVNGVGLFRNDGGGAFTHLPAAVPPQASSFGNTWADVDNDGDLDVFISGAVPSGSSLYLNQGGLSFVRVATGPIADAAANRAWGCAFGDYDADGWIDLVTAAAFGFGGITNPNRLFHNDGAGAFTVVDTAAMAQGTAPYTIPTWSDFDLDGDPDLWIGTGPANGTVALDYLYRNRNEVSPGWFERYTTGPIGTDLQDGQVYNWIDFDNDRDLDVYLTNYAGTTGGMRNRLYRNDGGTFTRMTTSAGPIVSDPYLSLASVWQDYDNDGDLDCLVTNDDAASNRYYANNGNGTFALVHHPGLTVAGPHYGAASGDYDDDGWMDLFVAGNATTFGLFRNVPGTNGWLKVRLTGVASNRAAIGARVRVLAMLGAVPTWQLREISAQNSFNGMNSLEAHFGLNAAAVADSVIVEWPSGAVSRLAAVPANTRLDLPEGAVAGVDDAAPSGPAPTARVSPNPGQGRFEVRLSLPRAGAVDVELLDVAGRRVATAELAAAAAGGHTIAIGHTRLRNGVYFLRVRQGALQSTLRVVVAR